jgi:hypothetical protein
MMLRFTCLTVETVRQGVIEPAVMRLATTNEKVRKKALLLLAKEDRRLQQERKYHEAQGTPFHPSAIQLSNQRLWEQAKEQMPAAAAEAEGCPNGKRERFTDHFKHQMQMQDKLIQQYTTPSALDNAIVAMLQNFGPLLAQPSVPQVAHAAPAMEQPVQQTTTSKKDRLRELQQLLADGCISQEEHDKARMLILTSL